MNEREPKYRRLLAADAKRGEALPGAGKAVDRLSEVFAVSRPDVDPRALSMRTLTRLAPEMRRRAAAAYRRRLAAVLVLSLLPLPFVLAYGAYMLRAAYTAISFLLPSALAAYVVVDYAAFLLLLFALTYAAIPLLVARRGPVSVKM